MSGSRRGETGYSQWKEIDLGDFPFKALKVADFNGDQRDDLLLLGADKFAVLYAGATAPALKELASFESQLEKVYPTPLSLEWVHLCALFQNSVVHSVSPLS